MWSPLRTEKVLSVHLNGRTFLRGYFADIRSFAILSYCPELYLEQLLLATSQEGKVRYHLRVLDEGWAELDIFQ